MKLKSAYSKKKNVEDDFHSGDVKSLGHVGDAESLEHDVRHALAALLHDRRRRGRRPKPRPGEFKSHLKH